MNKKIIILVLFLIVSIVLLILEIIYTKELYNKTVNSNLPSCYLGGGESEWGEREVAAKWTGKCKCVLEFGGGAGSVSTVVQKFLRNKNNHVVIQPAENGMYGGLRQLRKNKKACNSKFHIIDHILKPGEGTKLQKLVSRPFDCIVADCEGCLHHEYEKNPDLFKNVRLIQVERDDGGKYDELFKNKLHMTLKDTGKGCGGRCITEVWGY